jgi:hypothetical protein
MIFKMKKFYPILPLFLLFILFSCNQKAYMNIDEVPVPPEAKSGTIDGRYEVTLDAATNTILTELKKSYSKTQEKILFLNAEADVTKIFGFYTGLLAEKGLVKDESVPLQGRNYQLSVWKKGDQAVSVAVIEAGKDADGKPIKFLAIHLGDK